MIVGIHKQIYFPSIRRGLCQLKCAKFIFGGSSVPDTTGEAHKALHRLPSQPDTPNTTLPLEPLHNRFLGFKVYLCRDSYPQTDLFSFH